VLIYEWQDLIHSKASENILEELKFNLSPNIINGYEITRNTNRKYTMDKYKPRYKDVYKDHKNMEINRNWSRDYTSD
jgi:hypothetical protein